MKNSFTCYTLILLSILSCSMAESIDDEELNFISNVYLTLGQNLTTILAQKQYCKNSKILEK